MLYQWEPCEYAFVKLYVGNRKQPINEPNRKVDQRMTVLFCFSEGDFPWLENFILPFMYANANAGIPPQTAQVKSSISISSPIVLLHIVLQVTSLCVHHTITQKSAQPNLRLCAGNAVPRAKSPIAELFHSK